MFQLLFASVVTYSDHFELARVGGQVCTHKNLGIWPKKPLKNQSKMHDPPLGWGLWDDDSFSSNEINISMISEHLAVSRKRSGFSEKSCSLGMHKWMMLTTGTWGFFYTWDFLIMGGVRQSGLRWKGTRKANSQQRNGKPGEKEKGL